MGSRNVTATIAGLVLFVLVFFAEPKTICQVETQKVTASNCDIKVSKASRLDSVKLSRWSYGGWRTNAEPPTETSHVWQLISGKIDCPGKGSGLPLPKTALVNDASTSYFAVGYAGPVEHTEDADFNALEGSPGTGRTDAAGMVWGVIPAKSTGVMTLYLVDKRVMEKNIDISLLFAVPRSSGPFYLKIEDKKGEKLPTITPSGKSRTKP